MFHVEHLNIKLRFAQYLTLRPISLATMLIALGSPKI